MADGKPTIRTGAEAVAMGSEVVYQSARNLMLARVPEIGSMLTPFGMSADRHVQIAIDAIRRNPYLLKCTPDSIVRAVMQAAEIGLDIGGPLGDAYLVPFWSGKVGANEAVCIPGYRGLLHLAKDDPDVVSADAELVYEADEFKETRGSSPSLVHIPHRRGERGQAIYVYGVLFRRGDLWPSVHVMTVAEVDAIGEAQLKKIKGPGAEARTANSAWNTARDAMRKKTPLRRLCSLVDLKGRMRRALDLDAQGERLTLESSAPSFEASRASSLRDAAKKQADAIPDAEIVEDET